MTVSLPSLQYGSTVKRRVTSSLLRGIVFGQLLPMQCSLILILCAATVHDGDARELELLFSKAQTASGESYRENRTAILQTEMGVETFLKEKQVAVEKEDARWLAEILLVRHRHRAEIQKLEQEFHEKTLTYYRAYPDPSRGRTQHPGHSMGLLIANEPSPIGEMESQNNRTTNPLLKAFADEERSFWDSLHVSKSPYWPHLLGEIVMKGWIPDTSVRPRAINNSKHLSDIEYQNQAIALLGKFGEQRSAPWALRTLKDSKRDVGCRATAATCLGNLKSTDNLPELLKLCESSGDGPGLMSLDDEPDAMPIGLFQAICKAIVKIGDPTVVPEMQRISNDLKVKSQDWIKRRRPAEKIAVMSPRSLIMEQAARELQNVKP